MDKWHSVFVGVDVTSVFAPFNYIEQFHTPIHENRVFRKKCVYQVITLLGVNKFVV